MPTVLSPPPKTNHLIPLLPSPPPRWHFAGRTFFWTAVISLSLLAARLLLHLLFFRTTHAKGGVWREGRWGNSHICTLLSSPRLELFLLLVSVPGITQACTVLVRGTHPHPHLQPWIQYRCNESKTSKIWGKTNVVT